MAGYGYTKNKKIEENKRNYGEKMKKSQNLIGGETLETEKQCQVISAAKSSK